MSIEGCLYNVDFICRRPHLKSHIAYFLAKVNASYLPYYGKSNVNSNHCNLSDERTKNTYMIGR